MIRTEDNCEMCIHRYNNDCRMVHQPVETVAMLELVIPDSYGLDIVVSCEGFKRFTTSGIIDILEEEK